MGGHLSALLGVGQTAEWVSRKSNLKGKVAIVTGATSGIGYETARVLCKIGCKVYMGCRSESDGEAAKKAMLTQLGDDCAGRLIVRLLDLSSMKTVKSFADHFLAAESQLDFLILNAGIFGVPRSFTKEGFEWHFGVNFLGHFYLTKLLFPLLIKNDGIVQSRIIVMTCSARRKGKLSLEDLEFKSRKYSPLKAYSQSKLALWLFAQELASRLKRDFQSSICVLAVDPGACDTKLFRNVSPFVLFTMIFSRLMMKNVGQGSATSIYACVNNRLLARSGSYLENCHIQMIQVIKSHSRLRVELWEKAETLVENMKFDSYRSTSMGPRLVSGELGMGAVSAPQLKKSPLWSAISKKVLPVVRLSEGSQQVELTDKKSL